MVGLDLFRVCGGKAPEDDGAAYSIRQDRLVLREDGWLKLSLIKLRGGFILLWLKYQEASLVA